MKAALVIAMSLAAPLIMSAAPASAQADPDERARIEALTRRLNGAPPVAETTSAPQVRPSLPPIGPQPIAGSRQPLTTQAAPVSIPAPAPASAPAPALARAAAQTESAVDRAALPFKIDLPSGFQLLEGRAASGSHVYSVRKSGKTYLMIYAGPSSQFPIYEGDQVMVGARASIIVVEGARRIAVEHLFQRTTEPAEIHVWLMAQDGPERDEAERIAQTVDVN